MMKRWSKVGHVDLEKNTVGGYTWYLTGNKKLDTEMANLDDRIVLFLDKASESMKKKYDRQEDRNLHWKNAEMVDDFAHSHLTASTFDAPGLTYQDYKEMI